MGCMQTDLPCKPLGLLRVCCDALAKGAGSPTAEGVLACFQQQEQLIQLPAAAEAAQRSSVVGHAWAELEYTSFQG